MVITGSFSAEQLAALQLDELQSMAEDGAIYDGVATRQMYADAMLIMSRQTPAKRRVLRAWCRAYIDARHSAPVDRDTYDESGDLK